MLHTLDPFAFHITEALGIRWYGLSYLAGFLCGYAIIRHFILRGKSSLPISLVEDFVFTVALGTIIGGRLGYCFFYSPSLLTEFTSSFPFWGVLAIHKGGMASHGGIIGIFLACVYFAKKHKLNFMHLIDLTTLGGTLGIFFGRIANFVNGELVGRVCSANLPWAVKFPQDILLWQAKEPEKLASLSSVVNHLGVPQEQWGQIVSDPSLRQQAWNFIESKLYAIIDAVQSGDKIISVALEPLLQPRHPSQIYAALLEGAFVFLALLWIWRKNRIPGIITAWFFILYSAVRIFDEQFRMPDVQIGFQWLGLSRGQWLSGGTLFFGILLLVFLMRRKKIVTRGE